MEKPECFLLPATFPQRLGVCAVKPQERVDEAEPQHSPGKEQDAGPMFPLENPRAAKGQQSQKPAQVSAQAPGGSLAGEKVWLQRSREWAQNQWSFG